MANNLGNKIYRINSERKSTAVPRKNTHINKYVLKIKNAIDGYINRIKT